MCGIIACRTSVPALEFLLPGLRRLEYRGYDSAGVAVHTATGEIARLRAVGRIETLEKRLPHWASPDFDGVGIGHTRWATHGAVTERNAHPHNDCSRGISLVHNGVIDNAEELRAELAAAGHVFESVVDSEVIAHLVEDRLDHLGDLPAAVRAALTRLRGSWALAVLQGATGRLVVAAHRSPLVVARGEHGDFAASDPAAIAEWVEHLQVLRDGDVVELADEHRWSGLVGPLAAPPAVPCTWRPEAVQLGGYRDFMAQEIDQQPQVAARILDELGPGIADGAVWTGLGLPPLRRVHVVACGTSLHAGAVLARVLRRVGGIPVTLSVASEADEEVLEADTLTVAISQSGETADVLRAVEGSCAAGSPLLALTNNPHSTLTRRADAVLGCGAGSEIAVAATKTFISQVLTGVSVALSGLVACGRLDAIRARMAVAQLGGLPDRLAAAILIANQLLPALVAELTQASGFLFLARGSGLPYAAEGALKLKELTYLWAQSYPAGELKHGPLALVEAGTPVIVIDDGDPRLAGNLAAVQTRGARVISIGHPGCAVPVTPSRATAGPPPWGPLETVVPLQVLARTLALALGRDVDKPRNLAKSVTVD
ncbi:MAG: glutamine--fructose-6-phosphate transaminase (isomerizing) [Pseudonocardiaceae bacterium]